MSLQRSITDWFVNQNISDTPKETFKNNYSIEIEEDENTLVCFTDGSSLSNGKVDSRSGFSVWFPYKNIKISEKIYGDNPTNNRAELKAILESYKQADILDPTMKITLKIYTDSMLCINSCSKWIVQWKKNNWIKSDKKNVKNVDLLKLIDIAQSKRPHVYYHVKAHTGKQDWISLQNEIADKLATSAAKRG